MPGSINYFVGVRWATIAAVGAVAVGAAAVPLVTGGSGGGGALTGNLFVDDTAGTCDRFSTAREYDSTADAASCPFPTSRSTGNQEVLTLAQNGDTILVEDQSGGDDYGKAVFGPTDTTFTFKPMSGRPEIGQTITACAGCVIEGFKFEPRGSLTNDDVWACVGPPPAGRQVANWFTGGQVNICWSSTIRDFDIDGGQNAGTSGNCPDAGVWAVGDDWVLEDGLLHGVYNNKGMDVGGQDFRVENVHFYDFHRGLECDPDVHNECIYTAQAGGADFIGNTFENCPSGQGIAFLGNCGGNDTDNVLIENNVFAHTGVTDGGTNDWHPSGGGRSVFVGQGPCRIQGWVIRYNTFETDPDLDSANDGVLTAGSPKGQFYGNLGGIDCNTTLWDYHHNVTDDDCGGASSVEATPATNTEASPSRVTWWVSANELPGLADFRLTSAGNAVAGGAGDPSNYPATDRDGCARSSSPDAGAYEYGGC